MRIEVENKKVFPLTKEKAEKISESLQDSIIFKVSAIKNKDEAYLIESPAFLVGRKLGKRSIIFDNDGSFRVTESFFYFLEEVAS